MPSKSPLTPWVLEVLSARHPVAALALCFQRQLALPPAHAFRTALGELEDPCALVEAYLGWSRALHQAGQQGEATHAAYGREFLGFVQAHESPRALDVIQRLLEHVCDEVESFREQCISLVHALLLTLDREEIPALVDRWQPMVASHTPHLYNVLVTLQPKLSLGTPHLLTFAHEFDRLAAQQQLSGGWLSDDAHSPEDVVDKTFQEALQKFQLVLHLLAAQSVAQVRRKYTMIVILFLFMLVAGILVHLKLK